MKAFVFRNVQRFFNGQWEHVDLVVARGRIRYIGQPGSAPQSRSTHVFDWPDVCVLPGLINAHDHLELNILPRLGHGPYGNSYQWSESIYRPTEPPMADVLAIPLRNRLIMGGYKNLICGVTTVCHHNPYHRRVFNRRFPVKVVKKYRWSHSLGFGTGPDRPPFKGGPQGGVVTHQPPWIIHAAEGIDDRAAAEIAELDMRGLLADNTVIVHGVAIDERDIDLLQQRGCSLIWCPSSNRFLFNATAPVDKLLDRVPVALGSDSTLSADGDLLDELRAAADCDLWPRKRLIELVTTSSAAILRLADGTQSLWHRFPTGDHDWRSGCLAVDTPADLLFIPVPYIPAKMQSTSGAKKDVPPPADPSELLLATNCRNIRLVMVNGVPAYADVVAESIFESVRRRVSRIRVDGKDKLVLGPLDDLLRSISTALGRANFFGHELRPAPIPC